MLPTQKNFTCRSGNLGIVMEGEHTDLVVEDQQSMLSIENKVFRFFEDNEDDAGHTDVPCDDEGASRGLGNLPAGCIALILSYTSPRDVARLALVNHTFREASGWDLVWENMLPFNYSDILSLATDYRPLPPYSSKRDLYHLLCRQILLRDGTEGYWLDRATGGVCCTLSAKNFTIVRGDDTKYWEWLPHKMGSRFSEVAYSKAAVLVEVSGTYRCTLPPGSYTLSWRLQLAGVQPASRERHMPTTAYTLEHTKPVVFRLSTDDGQHLDSQQYLNCTNKLQGLPLLRGSHKWLEFDGGEFQVECEDSSLELQFSMTELHAGIWSSGLLLDGIIIRPTRLVTKVPQRVVLVAGELCGSSSLRKIKEVPEGSILVVGGYGLPKQTYSMPGGGISLNYV